MSNPLEQLQQQIENPQEVGNILLKASTDGEKFDSADLEIYVALRTQIEDIKKGLDLDKNALEKATERSKPQIQKRINNNEISLEELEKAYKKHVGVVFISQYLDRFLIDEVEDIVLNIKPKMKGPGAQYEEILEKGKKNAIEIQQENARKEADRIQPDAQKKVDEQFAKEYGIDETAGDQVEDTGETGVSDQKLEERHKHGNISLTETGKEILEQAEKAQEEKERKEREAKRKEEIRQNIEKTTMPGESVPFVKSKEKKRQEIERKSMRPGIPAPITHEAQEKEMKPQQVQKELLKRNSLAPVTKPKKGFFSRLKDLFS